MMKSTLFLVVFAVFSIGSLQAQDLSGTWQGTLQAGGRDLRVVMKISQGDAGGLKAAMYSIDQGSQGSPASTVTVQDSNVKMSFPAIGGTYEGKLNADLNSITGTFGQGRQPLPLKLTRATVDTAWAIPEPPPPPKPMAADADPAFEVATIKHSRPDEQGIGISIQGRRLSTVNTTVNNLITFAYGIHARQITNGPDWLNSDKYNLTAQPDGEGQPDIRQWKTMIRKLLADRFKLSFHSGTKELPVYALSVTKSGPKLTPSGGDPKGLPGLAHRALGRFIATNATMADFAGEMQGAVLDRPVVDQTGISGRWDFVLSWTPDEFQLLPLRGFVPAVPPGNTESPDLFNAIQQQLGLKLESTKAAIDVIIIDRLERPSEN